MVQHSCVNAIILSDMNRASANALKARMEADPRFFAVNVVLGYDEEAESKYASVYFDFVNDVEEYDEVLADRWTAYEPHVIDGVMDANAIIGELRWLCRDVSFGGGYSYYEFV